MNGARDRLLEHELSELDKSLDAQEARWVMRKLGVAIIRYRQYVHKILGFLFDPEFTLIREDQLADRKRIEQLEAENADLKKRMHAAGQFAIGLRARIEQLEKRGRR